MLEPIGVEPGAATMNVRHVLLIHIGIATLKAIV